MKKIYLIGSVFLLAGACVIADYFAVFGISKKSIFDFYELTFKTVEEETGAPIIGVYVRCFQKHNMNACTQKRSQRAGYLSVNIPVTKVITSTFLFEKETSIVETLDPKVHIMFIHTDYNRPVETVLVQELEKLSQQEKIIKLSR